MLGINMHPIIILAHSGGTLLTISAIAPIENPKNIIHLMYRV
jgi:hypothetical protein